MSYNFQRPQEGSLNLLSIEQVRTLLHELGHVMHALLSNTKYHSLSAPDSVPYDFVEFPSKMFENWITDPEFIEAVALHSEDPSKRIPQEVIVKLSQLQNFTPGLLYLSKGAYSLLDFAWHQEGGPKNGESIQEFEARVIGPWLLHTPFENSTLSSTFTHIFAGSEYAALFYSYLYSQAFADMAFTVFEEEGTTNPDVGARLEGAILGQGSKFNAATMYEAFSGEKFESYDAFFKRIGL